LNTAPLPERLHRIALWTARGYMRRLPRNVQREDVEQAALMGLADGLGKLAERGQDVFAPESDWYLRCRIRGAIIDWLRAEDWLPRRARSTQAAARLPIVVIRAEDIGHNFEADLPHSGPSPEDEAIARVDRERILTATRSLPPRLARIVSLHYERGAKFLDIANDLGVSEPRVSQLHARAIVLLRERLSALENGREHGGPELSAPQSASDSMEGEATSEPMPSHRTTRTPQSGPRPASPIAQRLRGSRLGAPTATSLHRPSARGERGAESVGAPSADCYRAPRPSPAGPGALDAPEDAEPEPEWFVDVDWQRADRGGVTMSAEARELVPVSSVLPEAGFDLIAELRRYQGFLIDQALLRTGGNKAQAAVLLGLNRTTLVEMLKRLRDSEPQAAQPLPMALVPLREQTRRIVMDTLAASGGNATRAADALGIGRTTMYRYLQRYLHAAALEGAAAFEGAAEPESPESPPEVVEIPAEREPDTLPGAEPAPPPPPGETSEPTPATEPASEPPEPPDEQPIGEPPAPQALKSEPPSGVWSVDRGAIVALRAQGLDAVVIARKLGCSRWLVEKALRTPAPLAKCGPRTDDPARAG
jgi:RNA polymerase sigma factor (sigma-70 family)